jgi:hypothetical protein
VLTGLNIVVHCVEEAIECLEFALETHQNQDLKRYLSTVELFLTEIVVDEYLNESFVHGVLVVRVSANAAHAMVTFTVGKGEVYEIDTVGVGV